MAYVNHYRRALPAGTGDGLTRLRDARPPLDEYLGCAEEAGIDRTVLMAAFHSDYATANREVACIVASRPDLFYGFAFLHAEQDGGRVRMPAQTAVECYGFVDIKMHRHDARITREICELPRAFGFRFCTT